MERRQFIKGLAFLSITPFIPNIPINLESIENSSIHWSYKTGPEIIADISSAIESIRKSTGFSPKTVMMPLSMAERLGFDTDKIPDDIELETF